MSQNPTSSINLTQARSRSICNYLFQLGVTKNQLIPKGYSNSKPRLIFENNDWILLSEEYLLNIEKQDINLYWKYRMMNRRLVIKRIL